MTNLLRANFYRLRRSRALWLCMAAAFALTALFLLRSSGSESSGTLETQLIQLFPFLPVFHGAFVSLYLGVEYQDGTLRNKLIAGHARGRVYSAYLITAAAGCFAITLAWLLSAAVGIAKLGWFAAPRPLPLRLGCAHAARQCHGDRAVPAEKSEIRRKNHDGDALNRAHGGAGAMCTGVGAPPGV